MSVRDDHRHGEEADLSPAVAAYYRQVLDAHGTDPELGACNVCGVARCADWRDAYDRLAAARQVMATPDRWQNRSSDAPWRR